MAKKILLHVGLVAIPVRLEVAVDKESSSGAHAVCTGTESSRHDPVRVKQSVACPTCGTYHSSVFGFTERGIEAADGKVVVLSKEELTATAGSPVTEMTLEWKSRDDVYGKTVASDSVQNVYPGKGGEKGYTALRNSLRANPELVAVSVWAPSTKNALWVVELVDNRVVASKRAWPEDVRATLDIPDADVPANEQAMFDMLVTSSVTPFDVNVYTDAARKAREELVKERAGDAVTITEFDTKPSTAPVDMLSALQASVTAIQAANKPKAVRKRRAPAKKTAAKRTTTKKAAAPLSETA